MAAQNNEIDFRSMPKIELHAHLSGSISGQCLHEIWERKKAAGQTNLEDPLVVMPPDKHDYDCAVFFPLFSSYIYHLINDAEALAYSTRSAVRDFAADGVVYLELRTTPRAMPAAGLDKAGYVDAVLRAMKEEEEAAAVVESGGRIRTRLILSVDRRNTAEEAREVVALARRFRDRGVVGVDLCGDPTKGDVALFTPAFESARLEEGLKITVHFAEMSCSAGQKELNTILGWNPDRLGHVIHVSDDFKRQITARRGIGLELCLSCNVHSKMIVGSFEAHHFGEWWRVDGPIVIPCTDDVGVFGSPVSNEWRLIQKHFGLSREEILGLARKGIEIIFGDEDDKKWLREIMW
ncbi:putative adenosine deaminase protein [Eutypa lata UCREL1]|uniref:Putative adenosine deaminase protein n=1 Tax=Eutypa lata (strain UCR-EL1) TaxID=1287681 RepID=M7SFF3_EUTLA|nr:putative adenosine deaminase protein [Eutypa lata UCREL1]